jgi:hypothetical protein
VVAFKTLRVATVVVPPEIVPETTKLLEIVAEEVEKVPVKVLKVRLDDAPGDPDWLNVIWVFVPAAGPVGPVGPAGHDGPTGFPDISLYVTIPDAVEIITLPR